MATDTLEERVTAMEHEVAELRQQLKAEKQPAKLPWFEQIFGIFANREAHEEATRLGREYRESWHPDEDTN